MPEPEPDPEPEHDKFSEINKYVHDIEEADDKKTIKAKDAYNQALISNTELEMLHKEAIEHGSGSNIEDIWAIRSESTHSETQDLDFIENMDKFQHSFAHNTMIEDLDKQLPVLAPTNMTMQWTL